MRNQSKRTTRKERRTSKVEVFYHGTLVDGTVLDMILTGVDPVVFSLSGAVPEWLDGVLECMKAKPPCLFFFSSTRREPRGRQTKGFPVGQASDGKPL
jgi:hypothetical protein